MNNHDSSKKFPMWILAFLCAALPIIAIHISWFISIQKDFVPTCIPYFDGCTSISRAARQGLANSIFKLIMLPSAIIQFLTWKQCRNWLKNVNGNAGKSLPYVGLIAGLFLVLYVIFLGTDGKIYQLMRRYGILVYFGSTFIGQLIMNYRLKLVAQGNLPKIMLWICKALLPLSLVGLYLSLATQDTPLNDEIENIIEWNLSLLMIIWFFFLSAIWKQQKL